MGTSLGQRWMKESAPAACNCSRALLRRIATHVPTASKKERAALALREFLLLNHLYALEAEAIPNPNAKTPKA